MLGSSLSDDVHANTGETPSEDVEAWSDVGAQVGLPDAAHTEHLDGVSLDARDAEPDVTEGQTGEVDTPTGGQGQAEDQ